CHVISLPASNLPLPLVNQNWDVMAGSTKASNTSATGLRISISAFAIGGLIPTAPPFCDCLLINFFPRMVFGFLNVHLTGPAVAVYQPAALFGGKLPPKTGW